MPDQPTNPSRHNFFSRLGAIIKGAFAHGRVVDSEDLPVVQVNDITELTVDEDSNLRTTNSGDPAIVAELHDIVAATEATQAATERLDDAVGEHDAVTALAALRILLRAYSSIPTPVADGDDVKAWGNLVGALGVFLTQGFDYTLNSVKTYEVPGFTITRGTRDCTVANTAYALAASSTPCFICFIWAREANAGTCIWGDSAITTVGAPLPKPSVAVLQPIPVADVALLYGASSGAGDDIDWLCIART